MGKLVFRRAKPPLPIRAAKCAAYLAVLYGRKEGMAAQAEHWYRECAVQSKDSLGFKDHDTELAKTRLRTFYNLNPGLCVDAIMENGCILEYAPACFQRDRDVALFAIECEKSDGIPLEYAGDALKNDHEVAMASVRENGWNLKFAGDDMKDNADIVFEALRTSKVILSDASRRLKNQIVLLDEH